MKYEILSVKLKKGTKKKLKPVAKESGSVKINGTANLSEYVSNLIYERTDK